MFKLMQKLSSWVYSLCALGLCLQSMSVTTQPVTSIGSRLTFSSH